MTVTAKLIVGADTGIGNALSRHLHDRGDSVIATCLGDGAELVDVGIDVISEVDVTSDAAVTQLATHLESRAVELEWLVHVAGVMRLDNLDTVDFDDMRQQFEVNTVGPLRVVRTLRGLLTDKAKVGVVTSRVGSLEDNGSGGDFAYRVSKAGANMVTLNLHHHLAAHGVAVQALHPGMVDTDLLKVVDPDLRAQYASVAISAATAAEQLATVLDDLSLDNSGRFQHANGSYLPW